ncbi:MAG: GerMN domain-containing protein [Oscillospiraceae bacterium]|jgi:germination protein M
MKRTVTALMLMLALLLAACASGGGEKSANGVEVDVYRVVSESLKNDGELIRAERVFIPGGSDWLHAAMKALEAPPKDPDLQRSMPQDLQILSYSLEDGQLSLELSREYLNLQGINKTVVDYCITLTLCALDEVESVSLYVNEEPQNIGMTAEDVLLYDTERNPYEKQIRLYFADQEGRYLLSEYHNLTMTEDANLERYVIEELLRGPNDENKLSVIPEGTEMLWVKTEDGICTVNFSYHLYNYRPDTVVGERLTIYSIVNSLTSLSGEKVKILIDGNTVGTYHSMSLAEPLERSETVIGPVASAKGEVDVNLYMALPDGMHLAAIPHRIMRDEYLNMEMTVLQALIKEEPEPGYVKLFSDRDRVLSAETRDNVCTVVLTEDFFTSREDKESIVLAVEAMVATLTDLDGVEAVRLKINDEPARYDDLYFFNIMTKNTDIIIE